MPTPHHAPEPCTLAPPGWRCSRPAGHDGPCAAIPAGDYLDVGTVDVTFGGRRRDTSPTGLRRCRRCGSLVTVGGVQDHDRWHDDLDRGFAAALADEPEPVVESVLVRITFPAGTTRPPDADIAHAVYGGVTMGTRVEVLP